MARPPDLASAVRASDSGGQEVGGARHLANADSSEQIVGDILITLDDTP